MVPGTRRLSGGPGVCVSMANASDIPVTYYNLGIRRNTSKDILLRWESECGSSIARFLRWPHSLSHVASTIRVIENGKVRVEFCGILRECPSDSARSYGDTKCLWLVRRRLLTTNRMRESKAFRLRLLARQKRLAFRTSIFFLHSARMTLINGKWQRNDGAHPRSEGYSKMARIIGSSPNWWFRATSNTIRR